MKTTTKPKIAPKERERLKKLYPLFDFTFADGYAWNAKHTIGHPIEVTEYGAPTRETTMLLDQEHCLLAIASRLMERHPHLHISAALSRDGILISLWIKRHGRDAEGITHLELDDAGAQLELAKWEEIAALACEPGWFFCSGHLEAHQEVVSDYHYFAGRYCKAWGEKHPDHKRQALNETYE